MKKKKKLDDLSDEHVTVSREVLAPRNLDRLDDFRLATCPAQLATSNYATLMISYGVPDFDAFPIAHPQEWDLLSRASDAFIYLGSDGYGLISPTEFTEHKQ